MERFAFFFNFYIASTDSTALRLTPWLTPPSAQVRGLPSPRSGEGWTRPDLPLDRRVNRRAPSLGAEKLAVAHAGTCTLNTKPRS